MFRLKKAFKQRGITRYFHLKAPETTKISKTTFPLTCIRYVIPWVRFLNADKGDY